MDQYMFFISFFMLAAIGIARSKMPLPAEVYWHTVLPNTPMPSALQDVLHLDRVKINENVDKLNYDQYAASSKVTSGYERHTDNMNVDKLNYDQYAANSKVTLGYERHTDNVNVNKLNYDQYAANSKVTSGYEQHTDNVNAHKLNYDQYVANSKVTSGYERHTGKMSQNYSNIDLSLFFLEKDLQPGTTKNMFFQRTNVLRSTFVPHHVAQAIPFSLAKLPEILHHFSIKPDTAEANAIKTTLEFCEKPEFDGEHKFCATSLESLVESSMLMLGTRNVQAVSTTMSNEKMPKQTYKVASSGLQRLPESDMVACHSTIYPFAVYYCHSLKGTKVYKVTLTGKDGTKVEAVAVCHTETAKWDPEHVAFQELKVKPGTLPICHILTQDNLLWIPNK